MLTTTTIFIFTFWTLQKCTSACSLTDIQQAQPSTCTKTDISIYQNADQNDAMEWMQLGLDLASNINTGAAIVTLGVGNLLDAIYAEDDLDAEFEDKINEEFNRLRSCITEKIQLNNAQNSEDSLMAYVLTFDELTDDEVDFANDFKTLVDLIRLFIKNQFVTPSNDLLRFTSYLPLYRALVNFYGQAVMTHLTFLGVECDETDAAKELLCDRFNEYKNYAIVDADYLISWINQSHSFILNAYTPDISHSTETCQVNHKLVSTQQSPSCNLVCIIHHYYAISSVNVKWGGKTAMIATASDSSLSGTNSLSGKLKITTSHISNFDCPISSSSCATYQEDPFPDHYERATQQCLDTLKQSATNAFDSLTNEINQWSTRFNNKYIAPINNLKHNVQNFNLNLFTSCRLQILGNDHQWWPGERVGKYFAIDRSKADCILRFAYGDNSVQEVYYSGDDSVRAVRLWRSTLVDTEDSDDKAISGHGRKNSGAQNGDWEIGKWIKFEGVVCHAGC